MRTHRRDWEQHLQGEFWKRMHGSRIKKEFRSMSAHPFLSLRIIEKHPDHPWDWRLLSRRRDPSSISSLLLLFPQKPWDWAHLSKTMPLSFISQHDQLPWIHEIICDRVIVFSSSSSSITTNDPDDYHYPIEFILQTIAAPEKWKMLQYHPHLTLDHLLRHPEIPWDWHYAMKTLFFSSHHLLALENKNIRVHYQLLSFNPYHRPSILRKHLDKPWDWTALARHPAFPPQIIHDDPILSPYWRWDHCLAHPRLELAFYHQIRRKVMISNHFQSLSQNHFEECPSLHPYYLSVRHRFLHSWWIRRRILSHLHLFLLLCKNLPVVLVHLILQFL